MNFITFYIPSFRYDQGYQIVAGCLEDVIECIKIIERPIWFDSDIVVLDGMEVFNN